MNEDESKLEQRMHLPVLPHSGKVQKLREEGLMDENLRAKDPAPEAASPLPEAEGEKTIEDKLLEGKIIAAISTVFDPEIPVNIYELGLIYNIAIDAEKNVTIRMTLTSPACPVAGTLPGEVERKVEAVEEVKKATVELVWEPTWGREMMSESAMLQLGMY